MTINKSPYEGDPRLFITSNGSTLKWVDGQPVMDTGIVNAVVISLFTLEGWAGNDILPAESNIGSDVELIMKQSITLANLGDLQESIERALEWMIDEQYAKTITVSVSNPDGFARNVEILLTQPNNDVTLKFWIDPENRVIEYNEAA